MHLLQETPIPMDNASITQKLKGHELAVDFIGAAFQFCNAWERLAPCMHNLYHRKKTDAALLVIVVHKSAKNIKRLDTVVFRGGW